VFDRDAMLAAIGVGSIEDLFSTIPEGLRLSAPLNIPRSLDQISLTRHYQQLAALNADAEHYPTFLGAGVYDHYVPSTVGAITGRSEFYTSYTPYQPEVSQGVLQSIYEFQTLISQLFAMDVANASMYDAATGLAEAAIMAADITGRKQVTILGSINPTYKDVIKTYVRHMGISLREYECPRGFAELSDSKLATSDDAAIVMQYPNYWGNLEEIGAMTEMAHKSGALSIVCVDPIALGMLKPPGEYGVDIAVGEGQSLGCTMGYGGPLLGLFAVKKEYVRRLPGRIVGATKDIEGKRAYVMTLRTREQDIRRERATSNICTNVALHALAATVYLSTMGRHGMAAVADLSLQKAHYAASEISKLPGFTLTYPNASFFKEFCIDCPVPVAALNKLLWSHGIVGGHAVSESTMMVAVTEKRTREDIDRLVTILAEGGAKRHTVA